MEVEAAVVRRVDKSDRIVMHHVDKKDMSVLRYYFWCFFTLFLCETGMA